MKLFKCNCGFICNKVTNKCIGCGSEDTPKTIYAEDTDNIVFSLNMEDVEDIIENDPELLYNFKNIDRREIKQYLSENIEIEWYDSVEYELKRGFDNCNFSETNLNSKPRCKLIGENGNVFNLLSIVKDTMRSNNLKDEAKEMQDRVFASSSYEEVLKIFSDYVDIY